MRTSSHPLFIAMLVSRLAPSPTGFLHLGNAWSFMITWLTIRKAGGILHLRIDDLDPQRSQIQFIEGVFRDLTWLGLDWDGEVIYQSKRFDLYEKALATLRSQCYPCFCTRAELRSLAGAPHIGDEGVPYPGTCRNLSSDRTIQLIKQGRKAAIRIKLSDQPYPFTDLIQGQQEFKPEAMGGDFALRRSDGVWAYHLASTVDDAALGINLVIRGRDILASTPRHIFLAKSLGYRPPDYAHVPLLLDQEGERLAKRHKSLSISALASRGYCPEKIWGYLGCLGGFHPTGEPCRLEELLPQFTLDAFPRSDLRLDLAILQ